MASGNKGKKSICLKGNTILLMLYKTRKHRKNGEGVMKGQHS